MAREQLSAKQYLILLAFICAPVVFWGAYRIAFTASISAPSVKAGQPVIVRGRYPGWRGNRYVVFVVEQSSSGIVDEKSEEASSAGADLATRSWLGYYRFETALDPIKKPGDYTVLLTPEESHGTATATLTVLPAGD